MFDVGVKKINRIRIKEGLILSKCFSSIGTSSPYKF